MCKYSPESKSPLELKFNGGATFFGVSGKLYAHLSQSVITLKLNVDTDNLKTEMSFTGVSLKKSKVTFKAKGNLDSGLIKDERNPLMWVLPSTNFDVEVSVTDLKEYYFKGKVYA